MRSQVYFYIVFILLISTHIIRIYTNTQKLHDLGHFSTTLVLEGGGSCWVQRFPVQFSLPRCQEYQVGEVVRVELVWPNFSSGGTTYHLWERLLPVSMRVQTVEGVQPEPFSWLWWHSMATKYRHTWKEWVVSPFNNLDADQTALARKLFLGSGEKLSQEAEEQITTLGLQHIFAVSGSHVSMFLVFLLYASGPLQRMLRFSLVLLVCLLILILAGAAGSVTRAIIMAIMAGYIRAKGRKLDLRRLLLWTCLVMLAINFSWAWDIGWQLSFMAMVAIIWVIPLVDTLFTTMRTITIGKIFRKGAEGISLPGRSSAKKPPSIVEWAAKECFSAGYLSGVVQATMLPLLWWHFDIISFAGILIMMLAWWVFPLVFSSLLIGLLMGHMQTIGLIHQSIEHIYSTILIQMPLNLLTEVMQLDQTLSILSITAELLPNQFVCMYVVVFGLTLFVADRVRSGQTKPTNSTGYSPLLKATHGAYY